MINFFRKIIFKRGLFWEKGSFQTFIRVLNKAANIKPTTDPKLTTLENKTFAN